MIKRVVPKSEKEETSEEKIKEKLAKIKEIPKKRKEILKEIKKLRKVKKTVKPRKWTRFLRIGGIIGEYIPIVGALPFWTLIVIQEMKEG